MTCYSKGLRERAIIYLPDGRRGKSLRLRASVSVCYYFAKSSVLPEPLAGVGADHFFVFFVHTDREAAHGLFTFHFRGRRDRSADGKAEFEGLKARECHGDHRRFCEYGEGGRAGGRRGFLSEEGRGDALIAPMLVREDADRFVMSQQGDDSFHRGVF